MKTNKIYKYYLNRYIEKYIDYINTKKTDENYKIVKENYYQAFDKVDDFISFYALETIDNAIRLLNEQKANSLLIEIKVKEILTILNVEVL